MKKRKPNKWWTHQLMVTTAPWRLMARAIIGVKSIKFWHIINQKRAHRMIRAGQEWKESMSGRIITYHYQRKSGGGWMRNTTGDMWGKPKILESMAEHRQVLSKVTRPLFFSSQFPSLLWCSTSNHSTSLRIINGEWMKLWLKEVSMKSQNKLGTHSKRFWPK